MPDFTDEELDLLRRAQNLDVTHRRIRLVLVVAAVFAGVILWIGPTLPPRTLVMLMVAYVGITAWEKVAYGRAVLRYKAGIQKLLLAVEPGSPESESPAAAP